MCGIPMEPPADAVKGRRLTFEQAVRHIGGMEALIDEKGWALIDEFTADYIWKYPEHGYCTHCGRDVGDLKARHNEMVICPACGKGVQFKHAGRGHSRLFDQFVIYQWRKSGIDPEAIVLTAAHVWRDSSGTHPENSPRRVHPSAIYVFRPGMAVTVYKNHYWHRECGDSRDWHRVDSVGPEHTSWGRDMEIVIDRGDFYRALDGTRIGRLYLLLDRQADRFTDLELTAIANCARRPWLEYLAKAGQGALAASIMRMKTVGKDIVPKPRARTPRALLGLTEAQWHEVRRDGIALTGRRLRCLRLMERMGLGVIHMDAVPHDDEYALEQIAPRVGAHTYYGESAGDVMNAMAVPEKLRRKAYRRMLSDLNHATEWRDYMKQLRRLNEDMTDPAILIPKDMPMMHQRMIERENLLQAEENRKRAEARAMGFEKLLKKLKKEYTFSACGLILRPYETAKEVVDEGTALHICIGSYANGYMEGRNIICCLRRAEAPDQPWRAVEFSVTTGAMVQDRGMYNDTRTGIDPQTRKLLDSFWEQFRRWQRERTARTA